MPNPQVNCRVPEEHHGLMRLVAAKLRKSPEFAEVLAGVIADMPTAPEPVSGPEVMEAIRDLQERLGTLEGRLAGDVAVEDSGAPGDSPASLLVPSRHKPIPEEDLREALRLSAAGVSWDHIAKHLGRTKGGIYKAAMRFAGKTSEVP